MNTETGEETPGSLGRVTEELTVSVPGFGGLEKGESTTGTMTRTQSGVPLENCENPYALEETGEITVTRLS